MARVRAVVAALGLSLGLAACYGATEQAGAEYEYPPTEGRGKGNTPFPKDRQSVLGGEGGVQLGKKSDDGVGGAGIGINGFLWRASLDTLAFMPLASADPFGGVIITDWYSPPEAAGERYKMTVYILDRRLRADGLKVAVFRQKQAGAQNWVESPVNPGTVTDLENAILMRARQLRMSTPVK
ncbi:MAG: DUF3576 domain-containing protein [Alphaproteobacteria bacterium]|nr:DUF3576 domain-containing protein [Alphaproteobacteria bacterium]